MHRWIGFWQCLLPELSGSAGTVLLILAAQFLPEQQQLLLFWLPELGSSGLFLPTRTAQFGGCSGGRIGWNSALVWPVFVTI